MKENEGELTKITNMKNVTKLSVLGTVKLSNIFTANIDKSTLRTFK